MSRFIIRKTEQGRYLVFTSDGKHISGTAYKTVESATAEITGWVVGWNAAIDRSPIMRWGWDIEEAQAGEAGTAETSSGSVHEHAVGNADAPKS